MILCSRELSLLTTLNSTIPAFSSATAGLSGKVTGVGVMGGSESESSCFATSSSAGDSVRAFFDRDEESSSDAFLLPSDY